MCRRMSQPPAGNMRVVKVLTALVYNQCGWCHESIFVLGLSFLPEGSSHYDIITDENKKC